MLNRSSLCLAIAAGLFGALCASAASAQDATVEKVVVKSTAHFDFAKNSIKPTDASELLAEVGKMKDVTWQSVRAVGYTDSVGSASGNQKLSEKRAAAVKQYLVGKGLAPTMIHTEGKASDDPVAPNTDDGGRAQNRRTDVQFEGIRTTTK